MYYVSGFAPLKEFMPHYHADQPVVRYTWIILSPAGLAHAVVGLPRMNVNAIDLTG